MPTILGIGADILVISRITKLLARKTMLGPSAGALGSAHDASHLVPSMQVVVTPENEPHGMPTTKVAAAFARRILCSEELAQLPTEPAHMEHYLALRFGLKESAYKALWPHVVLRWEHIEVGKIRGRKPFVRFSEEFWEWQKAQTDEGVAAEHGGGHPESHPDHIRKVDWTKVKFHASASDDNGLLVTYVFAETHE
jgi:phosphopantetheinyl transferase (holo-ACP synthase)